MITFIPIRHDKYAFDTSDINTDDRPLQRLSRRMAGLRSSLEYMASV